MPWLVGGCLVPDPEKFPEPRSAAPVVKLDEVVPALDKLIEVPAVPTVPNDFVIPFHAEDAPGDPPAAYLYLDWDTSQQQFLGADTTQESGSFDVRRQFGMRVNINAPCNAMVANTGCCHQVRLLATHESKLAAKDGGVIKEPDLVKAGSDLSIVVWWVRVAPAGDTDPELTTDCPTRTSNP